MSMPAVQLKPATPSDVLAASLKRIKPSATIAVTDKARASKRPGAT